MPATQSIHRTLDVMSADRFFRTSRVLGPSPSGPEDVYSRYAPHVLFVDSVHGYDRGQFGRDINTPLATIDYAVGLCTANRGDVIFVLPGHIETVSAANGLDLDVAGISVIGVGVGDSRPKIKHTATASQTRINANSVRVENILFTGDIDAVVVAVLINGKTDVQIINCEYRDVTGQCAIFLSAADGSDRLVIEGFTYIGDAAAGTTRAFQFNGCDELRVNNFNIKGNFSTAAINFVTTLSARVEIYDGYIWNQNAADTCIVDTITGCTGRVGSLNLMLTDNAANITEAVTGATFHYFLPINVCNLAGEIAMTDNKTVSTDA